ncbi:lipid phosphate phosphatase 1 [Chaetomidium leptoderma]|uniref:Lipid phosphate phosphatase 1 n=1 Tax=Chaetomidium leptoderma TaxID=669021 RepID=A0AAN6VDJ9_9PEZI|nr:lipid phosphate phosphatase 1 [Chaetomidium leptoderma]
MLPFHRRDVRREPSPATTDKHLHAGDSRGKQLRRFVVGWIKIAWRDLLTLAVLGAADLGIYEAPYAATRNFPITFDKSGDIVYPQFAYPARGWIVSPALSGVICVVIPVVIIVLAQIRIRSFWDCNNAVLGLVYAVVASSLFQVIIKQLIGGFRPFFLDVCQPDISLAKTHNATGLNGVGFHQIMYTVEVCTNPDKQALKNAMTSFPSGHSTTAFAGFVFLFLWMNAKLKVWADFHASFYWLAVLLAPLLGAALMAACLTVDQAHNWYDICAGSVIGTVVAFMVYRMCYAAVWDWRFNHIPLRRHRVFDYAAAAALTPDVLGKALFVRKLGWGRKRRSGRRAARGKARIGSNSSSVAAAYAGNGSTVMPHEHERGVRYPEPVTVHPNGGGQYYGRGENMV